MRTEQRDTVDTVRDTTTVQAEPSARDEAAAQERTFREAPSVGPLKGKEDPLLDGLVLLCRIYNRPATEEELTAGLPLEDGRLTLPLLQRAARRANLDVSVRKCAADKIRQDLLPVLVIQHDNSVSLLTEIDGDQLTLVSPDMETRRQVVSRAWLKTAHSGLTVFAAPLPRADDRAGEVGAEPKGHWFWSEIASCWRGFLEVGFAAALANVLAVAASLFAMQVYDRVIPNLTFATLWVLAIGVGLAIFIEALVRIARVYLMDATGRRLDLTLSSRLFERALGMRLEARPASTGSFVNQVREFDAVRDFFTSTTIGALTDIPFVLLFVTIIAFLGGPVAWVLVATIPCIVVPGLLAQIPLARLSRQHLREGSVRNGLLTEAITGAETVKATQSEGRFQRLWEEYSALLATNGMRVRGLSGLLTYSATAVQQAAYVGVLIVGVYQIAAGDMTVGALLACAILSSRAIAPLTQLAGVFARWQHMRASLQGLEAIMSAPVDRPPDRRFVHRSRLAGAYRFEAMSFKYDDESEAALQIESTLTIAAGAGTALLGANGSGKSTMLKLLGGAYQPTHGKLLLDGLDIRQLDPADLRRAIGYLPQDVGLFYGTLRDNLALGVERHDDEELLEALRFVGAESLVRDHPFGLDRKIGEGGSGVSGGQRQSIALARIWLRDPRIVVLDEPTAAMDHALELEVLENLQSWLADRTLIVATHRQRVLSLVTRAVVLKDGRPVADGPVDDVLAALSSGRPGTTVARPDGARIGRDR